VQFSSNDRDVLAAVDLCQPMYSTAPAVATAPLDFQLIVGPAPVPPGPPPAELVRHIHYVADGDWMAMQLGAWGHCQVDLRQGSALAVLTPELAGRADLVNLCLLNTVLTNWFQANGLAMLHATGLLRSQRALLLMAPHNSGKSTTALQLVLAGYRLLSDSQVYLAPASSGPTGAGLQLMGFPVGRIKLREDMLPRFLHLQAKLTTEEVRGEMKYMLDLRHMDPALVQEAAIIPTGIDVCLLRRSADGHSRLLPVGREEAMEAAVLNSLHYHTDDVWQRDLELIDQLLDAARWHRLEVGAAPAEIVNTLEAL
jgi:hypothetical protein